MVCLRLHPAVEGGRCKDPQPHIRLSSGSLVEERDRSEPVRRDTSRRPTESTNLGPWGLTEPQPPSRELAGAGPRSPTHL